ncbi:Versicolorin reductase-like protein 3 [Elsinoe fawcettii]|nr:Versicolorin reductase-like protein 3 [Elsinoe fawcettii]
MADHKPLAGKVALVSGSSSGIGAAIARLLSERGCSVVINYPFPSEQNAAQAVLASLAPGAKAIAIEADLSTLAGPAQLISEAVRLFNHIDILVNNAGRAGDALLSDITPESWNQVINLNARGTLLLTQAALPHLAKKNSRIVNIISATVRDPVPGLSLYAGSKAMVDAFTKTWAKELPRQYECTVNSVVPGPIQTPMMDAAAPEIKEKIARFADMTPVEPRLGTPEDIAWAVGMLCEEGARWINGASIGVSGGLHIH